MTREKLLEKIAAAKHDIVEAEGSLQELIRSIAVGRRAEKTTVSTAVQAAFDKLRAALAHLSELEALLARDEP